MPQLAQRQEIPAIHPSAKLSEVIYDSNPFEAGWLIAIVESEQTSSVAIRWKSGRLRPGSPVGPRATKDEWFLLPEELAGVVRREAERLEAVRQAEMLRGYQEMAADTERENEALEWIESHVGECL